jgi:hypothetical protein
MSAAPHGNVRGRWLSSSGNARGIATVELAGIIALTFVMIALATSAYRTYSVRAAVNASVLAVAPVQALIEHAFELTGVPPASERDVPGFSDALTAHRLTQPIAVAHGRIEIRFGSDAAAALRGKTLHVTPFETTDGRVVWRCGARAADVGLYALGFGAGTNRTAGDAPTIEPRYLPDGCR